MSTPGRARALRALAARKRSNTARMARGEKPIIGGKKVTPATYTRRTGMTKAKAKKAQSRRRRK